MNVTTTNTPEQDVFLEPLKLDPAMRDTLAVALNEGLEASRGQRVELQKTLDYWNDMVEMNVAPRDTPWPNAKSMCVPIVAMMMEAVYSRIVSAVFVPRLYIITALTPEAQQFEHLVESFYNAEFHRRKWLRAHLDTVNLGLRDGVSWMEILWEHTKVRRKVAVMEPTGETGADGKPIKRKTVREIEQTDYRGVKMTPVERRDLFPLPATSTDLQTAPFVFRRLYLTENQLRAMSQGENPTLWKSAVESILAQHSIGINDLASDEDGTATYEDGGTVQVGDSGSADPTDDGGSEDHVASKGLFEVFRVHTNSYDLDKDGVNEEVVLWYYNRKPTLLGAAPYEYWHGKRPFAKCAPMPRPCRLAGWGVPERERGFQEEANAQSNQRGDAMDLKLMPPMYKIAGAAPVDKNLAWGPHAMWEVSNPTDVGIIQMGQIDPASWQDEALTYRYAAAMVGIEAPTMPLMGNQKVPAKAQQQQQMASNVRLDLMALEVRLFCEEVLDQAHHLNLQYLDDEDENDLGGKGVQSLGKPSDGGPAKKFTVPIEALMQDFSFGVSGTEGALDQDSDRTQSMQLYALMLQNPLVQGNLERTHAVTSYVLDKHNLSNYTRFIGTQEDAKKQQEAMAQAQKQQHDEQLQIQLAAHSKNPSPTASRPPQPQPQQPAPQPMPMG